MKISDSQPPARSSDVKADNKKPADKADSNEQSAFSRVLTKKREEKHEEGADTKGGKRGEPVLDAALADCMQPQAGQPFDLAPVESKHMVAIPPELQGLVREIAVVVNAAGNQQVHIELNSNVMKGLHIQIERKDGAVAIQFQSSSDEVTRLLQKNTDALAQSLGERGVNVADIRVTKPGEAPRVETFKSRSGSGYSQGRGQGGRR